MEENVYFKEEKKYGEGKVRKRHFVKEKKRRQRKKKENICWRNIVYKLKKEEEEGEDGEGKSRDRLCYPMGLTNIWVLQSLLS